MSSRLLIYNTSEAIVILIITEKYVDERTSIIVSIQLKYGINTFCLSWNWMLKVDHY